MEKKPANETLWRVWVDTHRRIVSFHEEEGCQLLEFRSRETLLNYARTINEEIRIKRREFGLPLD